MIPHSWQPEEFGETLEKSKLSIDVFVTSLTLYIF